MHTQVLLCDFHRLQAWWRWLNKSDHGVGATRKKAVFGALMRVADAETIDSFAARWAAFQSSVDYVSNILLQKYLRDEWLPCKEMWARCYRQAYHGGINTNNHQEAMNRVLKHKFLKW